MTQTRSPASCVVLDIDGVLADVRHRLHHLTSRPKNWDAFFAAAPADSVLEAGSRFAHTAASAHDVVYLTGRPERLRPGTEAWLQHHRLPAGRLLMRREGDRRPAAFVKLQHVLALRRFATVELVVDDDATVVAALRDAGFEVQLADWMHADDVLYDAQEREGRS